MAVVAGRWRWLLLLAYPVCGLALGLADPSLCGLAGQAGVKPGVATGVSVDVLLPLVAVALGLGHGRLWAAWAGAVGLALGFTAGLVVCYPAGVREWSPLGLLDSIPPVMALAAVGYAGLGTVAALVSRARWKPASAGQGV